MSHLVALSVDVFPINVASGPEFLLIYALMSVLGVGLAKAANLGVLSLLTPHAPTGPSAVDAYRQASVARRKLTIGAWPSVDDVLAVAFLRAGERGVAEAIVAQAVAEGWLTPASHPGAAWSVHPIPRDAALASRGLAAELHATAVTTHQVRSAATIVAARRTGDLERELAELGLLHPPGRMLVGSVAYATVGLSLLGVGALRATRGIELGRPIGFLVLEMIAVAVALFLFRKASRLTSAGDRYLKWLGASTVSLRHDVYAGRTRRPADVALVGATAGLVAIPFLAAAWPGTAWGSTAGSTFGAAEVPTGSSACSSSSCSSSSCGGGGGCGSSSCGGGGGCGG